MRGVLKDDKNITDSMSSDNRDDDLQKDKKIKRLTLINRQLLQALKQQNDDLTKKISKQRLKGARSNSVRSASKNDNKQLESIRKELSNAYKQIDMYKDVIQNLKAKQVSLDNVDKIKDLENKVKMEDSIIENYQKQLKYLSSLRQKQEKQLKIYQNEEVKQTKNAIEKEIVELKEKYKQIKKNLVKRQQVQKRQHSYFVQLEKALRKQNDEYYPGKLEVKEEKEDDRDIAEAQWINVKGRLSELRKQYNENHKKLDTISRQKFRELKSYQQNELKLKEKMRKLNTLKSRLIELTKLTIMKEAKQPKPQPLPLPKKQQFVRNDKNKEERQVKKWNVPAGFSLEKGKVLPNSTFTSDKNILDNQHKFKIVEVEVWTDGNGVPSLLRFIYQNQHGQIIQGKQMTENVPLNLEMYNFKLKQKDYLWHISGKFSHGLLSSITLKSKLGKEATFQDTNSTQTGDQFSFFAQANDIPSCFYGATIKLKQNDIRICYLGCQFMTDW